MTNLFFFIYTNYSRLKSIIKNGIKQKLMGYFYYYKKAFNCGFIDILKHIRENNNDRKLLILQRGRYG